MEQLPELKVAAFGASGAGKTVLLAAFFHAQTQPAFAKAHRYAIQAVDKAQGSALLGRFYRLEANAFPDGTLGFDDFAFDFFVDALPTPALRVHWYDYPGRWWEDEPQDPEERAQMHEGLRKLASSDVGLLLIDGAKYRAEGARYLGWMLEHFADECARMARQAPSEVSPLVFPKEWILALSKADLFPLDYTAKDFEREVASSAAPQLLKLSHIVGTEGAFGNRFMLLSSVQVTPDHTLDPTISLGLGVLAPALLTSTLQSRAHALRELGGKKSTKETLMQGLEAVVSVIDGLDDFLPPKFQPITKILRALELDVTIGGRLKQLRAARDAAIAKGDAVGAIASSMLAVLEGPEGTRTYFDNQPRRDSKE